MSRKCNLIKNKSIICGNNVSRSNRKTRKKFSPNLIIRSFYSNILKNFVNIKVSSSAIRSIDHNYGLDNFLLSAKSKNLNLEALRIKKKILKINS